ncbi:MAG: diguanylate cyclase [Armatimonas sp.]
MLLGKSRQEAEALVAQLRMSTERVLSDDGRFQSVGFSVGIAIAPGDGLTEQALLDIADMAMYADKRTRKRALAA